MGIQTGSSYDNAVLRAYRHRLPGDVARKPIKPRRRMFSLGR